jgi:hypothetical protein
LEIAAAKSVTESKRTRGAVDGACLGFSSLFGVLGELPVLAVVLPNRPSAVFRVRVRWPPGSVA